MPKSNSLSLNIRSYNLRKSYPHESNSVIYLGSSRKRQVVKEAREQIKKRRTIQLGGSQKKTDLTEAVQCTGSEQSTEPSQSTPNDGTEKQMPVDDGSNNINEMVDKAVHGKSSCDEEVRCLFFKGCDEKDATPRNDWVACDGRLVSDGPIDDDVPHVSGPTVSIYPPVPTQNQDRMHTYFGQSIPGHLVRCIQSDTDLSEHQLSSETEDSSNIYVFDAFFDEFLREIRQSRW